MAWLLLAVIAEKSLMPLISFPLVLFPPMPVGHPYWYRGSRDCHNFIQRPVTFELATISRAAWICVGGTIGLILGERFPSS